MSDRSAKWSSLGVLALASQQFVRSLQPQQEPQSWSGASCGPLVRRMMRRWLRRARTRVHATRFPPLQICDVRRDNVLGLFPDEYLQSVVRSATLRCFFPGEALMYSGVASDEECYVIVEGTVTVRVDKNIVGLRTTKECIGSVGLITGEPRRSTVVTLSGMLFAWVLRRRRCTTKRALQYCALLDAAAWMRTCDQDKALLKSEKEAACVDSGSTLTYDEAMSCVSNLRLPSLRSAYSRTLLSHHSLRRFPLLSGQSASTLDSLLETSEPVILPPREVLPSRCSGSSEERQSVWYILLRGTARVVYRLSHRDAAGQSQRSLSQQIHCVALRQQGGDDGLQVTPADSGTQEASTDFSSVRQVLSSGEVVATVHAPALIFAVGGVLSNCDAVLCEAIARGAASELSVETATTCDLLRCKTRTLTALGSSVRSAAFAMYCNHMPPLRPCVLASILLPKEVLRQCVSSEARITAAVRSLASHAVTLLAPQQVPHMVLPSGSLECSPLEGHVYIILSGGVEGHSNKAHPYVWPAIDVAYRGFHGGVQRAAVGSSEPVFAIRVPRAAFVEWLSTSLSEHDDVKNSVHEHLTRKAADVPRNPSMSSVLCTPEQADRQGQRQLSLKTASAKMVEARCSSGSTTHQYSCGGGITPTSSAAVSATCCYGTSSPVGNFLVEVMVPPLLPKMFEKPPRRRTTFVMDCSPPAVESHQEYLSPTTVGQCGKSFCSDSNGMPEGCTASARLGQSRLSGFSTLLEDISFATFDASDAFGEFSRERADDPASPNSDCPAAVWAGCMSGVELSTPTTAVPVQQNLVVIHDSQADSGRPLPTVCPTLPRPPSTGSTSSSSSRFHHGSTSLDEISVTTREHFSECDHRTSSLRDREEFDLDRATLKLDGPRHAQQTLCKNDGQSSAFQRRDGGGFPQTCGTHTRIVVRTALHSPSPKNSQKKTQPSRPPRGRLVEIHKSRREVVPVELTPPTIVFS